MVELHNRDLKETASLMQSSFYKARFAAEYLQLAIRYAKLDKMVEAWDKGELNFIPACPREIYYRQLAAMEEYLGILEERAVMENVILSEYKDGMTFSEALKELFAGKRIALPEWAGFWYLHEDGTIHCFTKDDEDVATPFYDKYCYRKDWKIWDETNKQQLLDYQNNKNSTNSK